MASPSPPPQRDSCRPKQPPGEVLLLERPYLEVEIPRYEHAFVALIAPGLAGTERSAVYNLLWSSAKRFAETRPNLDILFAEAVVEAHAHDRVPIEEAGGAMCLFISRAHRNPRIAQAACRRRGAWSSPDGMYRWVEAALVEQKTHPSKFPLSPAGPSLTRAVEVSGFEEGLQSFVRRTRGPSFRAFNPSVHTDAGNTAAWVAFRVSNNTRCSGTDIWKYKGLDEMLLSDVATCELGSDLRPAPGSCRYLEVSFEALAAQSVHEGGPWTAAAGFIRGFEDPRLFRLNGQLALLFTVTVHVWRVGAPGCRVAVALLDDERHHATSAVLLSVDPRADKAYRAYSAARFEKNWVPLVVGEAPSQTLLVAYSLKPLIVLRPSLRDGSCARVILSLSQNGAVALTEAPLLESAAFAFGEESGSGHDELRGGSPFVRVADGRWLALAHVRHELYTGPLYTHNLVELQPSGQNLEAHVASPFRLPSSNTTEARKQAIQMVMGLAVRSEPAGDGSTTLLVSYGVGDCSAHLAVVPLEHARSPPKHEHAAGPRRRVTMPLGGAPALL